MKKIIFTLLMLCLCAVASAAEPAKRVLLYYQIPDVVFSVQNAENDTVKGTEEFEKFFKEQYSKRFDIMAIKRAPAGELEPSELTLVTRPNIPAFVVSIDLVGVGSGEKLVGEYSTVKVDYTETLIENKKVYTYAYGVKEYDSSMLRIAGRVIASEDDPRINTKNAVNDAISAACTFNKKINNYVDPVAYAKESNRFAGKLDALQ